MPILWILVLLLWLPASAEVSQEISRACQRDDRFYRACISNLEGHYRPGYRAYDLFAYLEKPGALALKTGPGALLETGYDLDLALDGPGYFVLSRGRLLRSGALRVRQGKICTAQGDLVLRAPDLQPLEVGSGAQVQVTRQGVVRFIRPDGDGKPENAGRLAIASVAHPRWLSSQGALLSPTPASGPIQLVSHNARVLSKHLELSNASPLEQQQVCRGLYAFAGLSPSAQGHSVRARRDLVQVIAGHDRLCAVSLENLKHASQSGYRASDVVCSRLRVGPGPLHETKDPYHLAIDGKGYFSLSGGLITRDGAFQLDRDGYLVTVDGCRLMTQDGPLKIPAEMSDIVIKADGTVVGTRLNGDGRSEAIGQIALVQVDDDSCLQRSGPHLRVTPQSGPARLDVPGRNGGGVVVQGYLEYGNLNPIEQIKMLHALRNYAHLLGMPLADDYQP
ncbi:hypothetical protein JST97_02920 [bacterium]|nr:hypothetical protein [bacterium]